MIGSLPSFMWINYSSFVGRVPFRSPLAENKQFRLCAQIVVDTPMNCSVFVSVEIVHEHLVLVDRTFNAKFNFTLHCVIHLSLQQAYVRYYIKTIKTVGSNIYERSTNIIMEFTVYDYCYDILIM